MKNLLIILIAITASVFSSINATAQYSIPSYGVEIVTDPTTFEEGSSQVNIITNTNNENFPNQIQTSISDEERKVNVRVTRDPETESASATIFIYSLDEQDVLGPFLVSSGTTLEQAIDQRDWGVEVVNATVGCIISTWID